MVLQFFIGFLVVLLVWMVVPWVMTAVRSKQANKKPSVWAENNYRKATLQFLGGFALLASFLVSAHQFTEARRSADTTDRAQQLAMAYELLGKGTATERIGGIAALQSWADRQPFSEDVTRAPHRPEDRQAVLLATVESYVRDQTTFVVEDERCSEFRKLSPRSQMVTPDVERALAIISEHSLKSRRELQFRGLNLSRAKLTAEPVNATPVGRTAGQSRAQSAPAIPQFDRSNLAYADLSEARLTKSSFKAADLSCANLYMADLSSAVFRELNGSATKLQGAYFVRSVLKDTKFNGASLAEARFDEAKISGTTDFSGADLQRAQFFYVDFQN
jgi:uncharacterized protein YjbI with pentapeptide repeats